MAKLRTIVLCFVLVFSLTTVTCQNNGTSSVNNGPLPSVSPSNTTVQVNGTSSNNANSPLNALLDAMASIFAPQNETVANETSPLGGILGVLASALAPNNATQATGTSQNNALSNILNAVGSLFGTGNGTEVNVTTDGANPLSGILGDMFNSIANNSVFEQILGSLNGDSNGSPLNIPDFNLASLAGQPGGFNVTQIKMALKTYQPFISYQLASKGVGDACSRDLFVILQGILNQEMWALRMLDAFGKPESGLLNGQLKWLGSYDECINIEVPAYGKSGPVEPFNGRYCGAAMSIKELIPAFSSLLPPNAYLYMGTCVSNSCSSTDVDTIIKTVLDFANVTKPGILYNCVEAKKMKTDAIAVTCFLAVLGAIVVIGTLYDVVAIQMKSDSGESTPAVKPISNGTMSVHSNAQTSYTNGGYTVTEITNGGAIEMETKIAPGDNGKAVSDINITMENKIDKSTPQKKGPQERGVLEQMLLSFSVYTNGVKLLGTNQGAGSLGAVNGVRFLSMCWVILGHTYFFALNYDANLLPHIMKKTQSWPIFGVLSASVSVDSFFALSGILVAYLSLREFKKAGGGMKINWFMFYFHRFWRLTPPYMLVLMVGTVILPYVLNGPMWSPDLDGIPFMNYCRENWWTNLLYVNNYVNGDESCMGWSWYLANDMQFYVISPLILLPLFYNVIAGGLSCLIFLVATITATAVINQNHQYPAQSFNFNFAPKPLDDQYGKNLYMPSYARMGPYVVGLFTGYVLYRWKCKCKIPKVLNLLCWFLCISVCTLIIYSLYSDGDSHIFTLKESTAYNSLHRTAWGLCVSWIVFSCACGHGGWINQVLSWKPFIPLGRLTYCAYLVHPLVMLVFYMGRQQPTYFSDYEVIYLFIGQLVMSYGVAFVVSLFFESPMMGLEKAVFKRGKK